MNTHLSTICISLRRVAIALLSGALLSCASSPPPPSSPIRTTDDPQLIERGRYLVYGPAHCVSCHGDPARMDDSAGAEIPLSGGRRFDLGVLGTITAPNITPDPASGIGRRSDDDLVRALRYGISHSGRPLIPFMSFAELSDRDLQAIISFLRSQSPARNAAKPDDLNWLGALAVKIVIDPERPKTRPAAEITPEHSASYGRYLATAVANCRGCHTKRSKLTGAFVGRPFAGGMELEEHGSTFITPNLTTAADGVLRGLDERQFIKRFRTRAQMPTQSPMPWTEYARMTDADLGAIYLYLKSLPPTPAP